MKRKLRERCCIWGRRWEKKGWGEGLPRQWERGQKHAKFYTIV